MITDLILFKLSDLKDLSTFLRLFFKVDKNVNFLQASSLELLEKELERSKSAVVVFKSDIESDVLSTLSLIKDLNEKSKDSPYKSICLLKSNSSSIKEVLEENLCNLSMPLSESPPDLANAIEELISITRDHSAELKKLSNLNDDENEFNIESGSISVTLKQFLDGQNISYYAEFLDMFDDKVVLKLPKATDVSQTHFFLSLNFEYDNDQILIESRVVAIGVEPYDENYEAVEFKVRKECLKSIMEFHKLITKRQGNINIFMEKARGY